MNNGNLLVYTRTPITSVYSTHLAYSVHLAYSKDGKHYQPLNQNYGILYSLATISDDNTLNEKALKKPYLFRTEEGDFGIIAVRVNFDGSDDEECNGSVLLWTTKDFIHFSAQSLFELKEEVFVQEAICEYVSSEGYYVIRWKDRNGNHNRNIIKDIRNVNSIAPATPDQPYSYITVQNDLEGAMPGNTLCIDSTLGNKLLTKWSPLENVSIQVPASINASSVREINAVRATATYNDGSTAYKQVIWDTKNVDFTKSGQYEITGKVFQNKYTFPLAVGYADPVILHWKGKYYFIATNDNKNAIGLYVREATSAVDLFAEGVKEYILLDYDAQRGYIQTFWAPEFHVIGDDLYILFAVGGEKWGPQSHMMKLKKDGDIIDPTSWEKPIRVMRPDGSFLTTNGITLDMTYYSAFGSSYLLWSYRVWSPEDSGSMIYIGEINAEKPWQLISEPVLLTRPLFGWENNEHTINNEGPYPIVTEDTVYITYSGGAAGGYTYAIGLLAVKKGEDPLNAANWVKSCAPILSYYSMKNVYGPGHSSCFTDNNGDLMITYHAQEVITSSSRCTGIHRVHFDYDGIPRFDMSYDRDLNEAFTSVKVLVNV